MIPSDLAARLRVLAETSVQPLAPIREIPAELPEFAVGQRFLARIERVLPDGNFRALVDGRTLTLTVPFPARPGETLDLVVTGRTAQGLVAQRAGAPAAPEPAPGGAAPPSPAATTTLSRAAQLIGALLGRAVPGELLATSSGPQQAALPSAPAHAAAGEPTRTPVAPGAPLLALPPAAAGAAGALAPALARAVGESGLFYESHQAEWIAGRLPRDALAREPQAQQTARAASGEAARRAERLPAGAETSEGARGADAAAGTPAAAAPRLAPELQTLVQQQLDTAATQQFLWRGELWPGQSLDWEIHDETPRDRDGPADAPSQWSTGLRLTLPRLGGLEAALRLTADGVAIAIAADDPAVAALRAGVPALAGALEAAGIPLRAMAVEPHAAHHKPAARLDASLNPEPRSGEPASPPSPRRGLGGKALQ